MSAQQKLDAQECLNQNIFLRMVFVSAFKRYALKKRVLEPKSLECGSINQNLQLEHDKRMELYQSVMEEENARKRYYETKLEYLKCKTTKFGNWIFQFSKTS